MYQCHSWCNISFFIAKLNDQNIVLKWGWTEQMSDLLDVFMCKQSQDTAETFGGSLRLIWTTD